MSDNFLSVTEFAKKECVTGAAVRKAIKDRRIWAEKVGKQWVIGKEQTLKKESAYDPFRNRYQGN